MSDAAERRRHKRYEIELPGRIGPAGAPLGDCMIRDYCSGGMLIELLRGDAAEAPASLVAGQAVEVKMELLTGKGARRVRIEAAIAWAKGDYVGVCLSKTSGVIVNALQFHDRISRTHQEAAPAPDGVQHVGATRCLSKLRDVAQGFLPDLLKEIVIKAGDDLLNAAGRGVSDKERQQIYSDITALEGLRSGDELLRSILDTAFEHTTVQPDQSVEGELSPVDPGDFERWLEASRVSNLLERKYTPQLSALASRLKAVRDPADGEASAVPFEPHHFTAALKELARQQNFGVTSRGVLFDRAAKLLQDKLGDLYAELDEALNTLGVPGSQSKGKVTVLRPPQQKRRENEPRPAETGGQAMVGHPAAASAALPYAMDAELLKALQTREARQRESQARELMSFVGELPNMTSSMTAWMQQLNGLMVREAVADKTFFHNRSHPLREIVDGLGHLQMFRRSPDLNPAEDPLHQRIAELLKPVNYDDVDVRTLRAVAESLDKLTAEQSRLYQRNVERVVEASEGRDRVRRARKAVVAELNKRYAGRQVPGVVPELLEVGWRAVLELALLNGVDGGAHHAGLLQVLDVLVGHLGGDAFEEQAEDVSVAQMQARIEGELARVSFDPFRRNAIEARLRAELNSPGPRRAELIKMPALGDENEEKTAATPPVGVSESAWQHALERCAAVKVGDYLHLLDAPEGAQELRVAWIRGDRELLTLVDYRGLRVRDITLFDVALGLHRRRIELDAVDGRPLSDRAVDNMLSRMESHLTHQATHDSLTGLIGRQQFDAALGKALAVPGRSPDIGVMLWIDIDQFRLVNDVYGYDIGDRLLIAVAKMLQQVKGVKVLAHLGSDRFGALLPDIPPRDGERRADQICEAVRNLDFEWPGQGMSLSVSVAVVGLAAGHKGAAGLLHAAEGALAMAKAGGGDQFYSYNDNDPVIAQRTESVQWVVRVDEALEHGELKLRCQPIVPVRPNEGLSPHYEVLLGVTNGASESLPIAEFIEAAESYNRMRAVDRWVVRTTMEWIDAHRQHMPALHGFAVNLSGQTASDPSFIDFVRRQFQRTRVDPAWLSFEVTETAAVADLSRTAGIIRDLKAMGCMVALDDFGSGQASYSYLKELPVDWLKIDGAFVRKIAADQGDFAVVKSINEIGHFLGKKTIAEYVSSDKILSLVCEIGVDFAQGFGISPPLLLDDLVRTDAAETGGLQAEPLPGPIEAYRRNHQ